MALSHVLLTSLMEKPSTGSELARRFDRSMGFFWTATHQQIYRELAQMQQLCWISSRPNDGRKKTYQVEALGRQELVDWLSKHNPPAQLREDLMVRLRAQAQFPDLLIMAELQQHLQLHQAKLQLYQSIFAKDFTQKNPADANLWMHQAILELGIEQEQGCVNCLQGVLQQFVQYQLNPLKQPNSLD